MPSSVLTTEQYKTLSRQLLKTVGKQYKIVPLNSLKHPKYRLKTPIHIFIEFEKAAVIASLDDIEAFACADTEFEAINQLCNEIVLLYEDLKADKENLGGLPRKWLAYLEEIIACK